MRRIVKWLIILAIPVGLIMAGMHFGQQYLKAKAIPRFTTVKVTTGKIENVVNSTGPIKPVQSVSVGSFVSGPIAEILVDFNDHVKKGQLLARIDPRLSQAAYDRDKANLQTQKAEVNRIEAQLKQAVAMKTGPSPCGKPTRTTFPNRRWTISTSAGSPSKPNSISRKPTSSPRPPT